MLYEDIKEALEEGLMKVEVKNGGLYINGWHYADVEEEEVG